MISSFICTRMSIAAQLYQRSGNTLEAEMLMKRIAIADPRPDKAEEQAA
jgi:hypothetical protein